MHAQMELMDSEQYFTMLMEHAVRGLVLLGSPTPTELMAEREEPKGLAALLRRLACCVAPDGPPNGRQVGVCVWRPARLPD
jgi:hypothetical protein